MVKISAKVNNRKDAHDVVLSTGDNTHSITIPAKSNGMGSSANGAELLFLALATCYCNDIYREAQQSNLKINGVQVEVEGDFDGVSGHPVENIVYHVTVDADAREAEIMALMRHTDSVAEIQNTLRQINTVKLGQLTVKSATD